MGSLLLSLRATTVLWVLQMTVRSDSSNHRARYNFQVDVIRQLFQMRYFVQAF